MLGYKVFTTEGLFGGCAGEFGRRLRGQGELHQHLFARDVHGGELAEPLPQPLHLPPAHGALLGNTVFALGEDVEFALFGQKLDLHPLAGLLPGLTGEPLFQAGQAALRRANQIERSSSASCGSAPLRVHRWIALAHFRQNLFGWNAAVHHPDAARLAVLRFNLAKEAP